jgi:hypothetical protein
MGVSLDDVLGNNNSTILEDKGKKQMNILLIGIVIVVIIIVIVAIQMIKKAEDDRRRKYYEQQKYEIMAISNVVSDYYDKYLAGNPEYSKLMGISQESLKDDQLKTIDGEQLKYGWYFVTAQEMTDSKLAGGYPEKPVLTSSAGYLVNYSANAKAISQNDGESLNNVVHLTGVQWNGQTLKFGQDIVNGKKDNSKILIGSVEDMKKLQDPANWNARFVLNRNIDMSKYEGNWSPIGNGTTKFNGSFDGAGYVISNLKVNMPNVDYAGFFGFIGQSGRVQNLVLKNVEIVGGSNCGAVAAVCEGGVSDTKVNGLVQATGSNVGGVFGTLSGSAYQVLCNVNTAGRDNVGGFAGTIQNGTVSGVFVKSGTTVKGNDSIGGLVGLVTYMGPVHIEKSFAGAKISAVDERAGGLVGFLEARSSNVSYTTKIDHSYSTGSIENCPKNAGGLIGEVLADGAGTVSAELSYSTTEVDIKCTENRGGFIGKMEPQNVGSFAKSFWVKQNIDNDINGKEIIGIGNEQIANQAVTVLPKGYSINQLNSWNDGVWVLVDGKDPTLKDATVAKDWEVLTSK